MVGGKVIEVLRVPGRLWINTQEQVWNPLRQEYRPGEVVAIYVQDVETPTPIAPGDSLWWQGTTAYWTPLTRQVVDYPLPRIGYSGVSRP